MDDLVRIDDRTTFAPPTVVMAREEIFADETAGAPTRASRDLSALIRISAAINAVQGLVALERPLLALIAEVIPADRGAIVLCGDSPNEIALGTGWTRAAGCDTGVDVSRLVVERVLREGTGILSASCRSRRVTSIPVSITALTGWSRRRSSRSTSGSAPSCSKASEPTCGSTKDISGC